MKSNRLQLTREEANACLASIRTLLTTNPHIGKGETVQGFTIETKAVNALLSAENKLSIHLGVRSQNEKSNDNER